MRLAVVCKAVPKYFGGEGARMGLVRYTGVGKYTRLSDRKRTTRRSLSLFWPSYLSSIVGLSCSSGGRAVSKDATHIYSSELSLIKLGISHRLSQHHMHQSIQRLAHKCSAAPPPCPCEQPPHVSVFLGVSVAEAVTHCWVTNVFHLYHGMI